MALSDTSGAPAGPLAGVRVLEIARVLMGPFAAQMLGDLGAEVIKVEDSSGDPSRQMGPGNHPELSGVALNLHRNKRSVVLDLKQAASRVAIERLIASSDVIVTNIRVAGLERLALSYDDVRRVRPDVVYCRSNGFRSTDPDRDRPVLDDVVQAMCGLPSLNEASGAGMRFIPVLLADKVGAMTMVSAVLAALFHRERTGEGQQIEVPMFDAILSFCLTEHLAGGTMLDAAPGYSRILAPNRGPHQTLDGWIAITPYFDHHWAGLFDAVGLGERMAEPWHANFQTRIAEADRVYADLKDVIAKRTTAQWIELCDRLDIPAATIASLAEIVTDPSRHRGVLKVLDHPSVGPYRHINSPYLFSRTPLRADPIPAPRVGADSAAVLAELGFSEAEIDAMVTAGTTRFAQ